MFHRRVQPLGIEPSYHALQACAEMTTLAQVAYLVVPLGFEPRSFANLATMPLYKGGVLPLNYGTELARLTGVEPACVQLPFTTFVASGDTGA